MAKRELFNRRLIGWFLNCLGALPIRRGESDEEAVATTQAVLARGDAVVIFPEGTRIRSPALASQSAAWADSRSSAACPWSRSRSTAPSVPGAAS